LIDKLTCKFIQNTISKFRLYLNNPYIQEDLVLFNIEPKGDGKLERCYPIPRISVPGGKMEDGDLLDFEKCALREFKEETGIDITFCHQKLSREKIKKGFRFSHFSNNKEEHKTTKIKTYYSKNKFDTKYISMYYLVRID
jgi:8-oxo-dGTP pyrophosphatase MutT (NUDIX family)